MKSAEQILTVVRKLQKIHDNKTLEAWDELQSLRIYRDNTYIDRCIKQYVINCELNQIYELLGDWIEGREEIYNDLE